MRESVPKPTEVIAERIRYDSHPEKRDDPYIVTVIFQGGAMRGVISAGGGVALQSVMGDSEPFERTDDTSAGAFHWSSLASRNGVEGTSIY